MDNTTADAPDAEPSRLLARPPVRWLCWGLYVAGFVALIVLRLRGELVPGDLSAYLSAVDAYLDGGNPYGSGAASSPHHRGYPFVYPPASLHLLRVFGGLSLCAAGATYALIQAVALAYLARRSAVLAGARSYGAIAALILALFAPISADILVGNIAIFLLAATLAVDHLARQATDSSRGGAYMLLGFLYALKLPWLLPAAFVLAARRRWRGLAALLCGTTLVFAASAATPELFAGWLTAVASIPAHFPNSWDLLALAPAVYPVALAGWAVAVWAARGANARTQLAIGATSVVIWPRLAPYSFAAIVPAVAELARRDRRLLAALLPAWGPVYWGVSAALPPIATRWFLYGWAATVAGATLGLVDR